MTHRVGHLRGPIVALIALALSAGFVLGAEPLPADDGAAETGGHGDLVSRAASMTEPAGFKNHGQFVSCVAHLEDPPADFDPATLTPADCERAAEEPDPEAPSDTDDADDGDNHGSVVSRAAAMATPDGFKNHGQFVSCVAHLKDVPPDFDPATLTPGDCEREAKPAKSEPEEAPVVGPVEGDPPGKAVGRGHEKHGKAKGHDKKTKAG